MSETWKPVGGVHVNYEISDEGRVRRDGRVLKALPARRGYLRVCLSTKGVKYYPSIHSLVAAAFIGPRPAGLTINHKDGVVTNNHVSNLEYLTSAENSRHAREVLGRIGAYRGPRPPHHRTNNKLEEPQVRVIKHLLQTGEMNSREIARLFSVSPDTILGIGRGRVWRTVQIQNAL